MYELIQLSEHDYYIDCPSKMGIVLVGGDEVVMIDSGNDGNAAKKALRHIEEKGWKLRAVFATHSHADHIGGCRLLQARTGCSLYASEAEAVIARHTLLEPACLYGGNPFKDLKNKFLMAHESDIHPFTDEALPEGMSILPLQGHSSGMTGYLTADGNAFIADSISSEETIKKHGIIYQWDPAEAVRSLEYLKTVRAERYIPSHAEVCEDITELAELNIASIYNIRNTLLELCASPVSFDELLTAVFRRFGINMNLLSHALDGSTVRSYLSWLKDDGLVSILFEDDILKWQTSVR